MPRNKKQLDQDESDNDDSDDSEKQLQVNTDNSPKIIPVAKLPDKLRYKKVVLNVSDTQYPIVTEIGEELGWVIQDEEGAGDWDVWWTDREIEPNTLYRMNLHQKINHFPGIYVLARKNLLGLHLMAMQRKFPNDYNFFPETWMLPMQFHQFRQYYESIDEGKVRTYIVKPEALSQGRGIFLTRNIEDLINGRKYVVQRYLKNPLLLDGLKFDLRIYVLLAGSQPLRLYIYEQGLARLATRPYQAPTAQNLHQNYIHLTNYSLNKSNPDYVFNKSDKEMDVGHKRSLKGVYERLAKNGIDVERLKGEIEECIIKTVISGLPSIRHQYAYCQPEEYEGNMCFHILGFDVMIMDDLKPIVIEVNHTPSFETGTPLDYMIKKNLIKDTLKLMRISSKNKKTQFQKAKQLTKKRIQTGKRDIFKGEERKQHLSKAQEVRDQQEQEILFGGQKKSGYKVIFPFKDQKKNDQYAKFYDGAQTVMKQLKNMRKKIISQETSSPPTNKQPTNQSKTNIRQSKTSIPSKQTSSIQRSLHKKPSIMSSTSSSAAVQKQRQQPKTQQEKNSRVSSPSHEASEGNMESSGGNSSSSESQNKRRIGLDVILENHDDQHENHHQVSEIRSTPNTAEGCGTQTDKKIVYSSMTGNNNNCTSNNNKTNFHIRNNNHKYAKKCSLNEKLTFQSEDLPHNFLESNGNINNSKYHELMAKFVRSKDLEDTEESARMLMEGQILLEQKLGSNSVNKKSRNSIEDEPSTKDVPAINFYAELREKERFTTKTDIIISSIKGYKQKVVAVTQQHNRGVSENFYDGHLSTQNRSSKGKRSYGSGNSLNIINKPKTIENIISPWQNDKLMEDEIILHATKHNKEAKKQKSDLTSKLGKFLKPKTYNLHESKFPHENKFIVRMDPNNINPMPTTGQPNIEPGSMSPNGGVLSFQQYNDFCMQMMGNNSGVTAQVAKQGYGGRMKISVNHRNVSAFVHANSNISANNSVVSAVVNTITTKPSTSHKTKSNSMIYRTNAAFTKDNPALFKIIQKSKIKGYQ